MKKKILYWFIGIFIFCGWADLVWGQTTFTQEEALEMIKKRDAQWEGKIEKADSLIASQKVVITDQEKLIEKYEEQAKVDVLIVAAKDKQIEALRTQNEAHEKMVKLVKPKWYENQYLWLVVGFIFGKI